MHEYDVALKRILTRPGSVLVRTLTGASTLRWLNVEMALVRNLRLDLLGETPDGGLVHIELQSRNEATFPLRMGEYSFAVGLKHGRLPRQVALYVGSEPMTMASEISWPGGTFRFELVDIREFDGEALLASNDPGDNVLAILTAAGREPEAVRRVLKRIDAAPPDERETALAELLILAGLRKLSNEVRREARLMPIQEDIMDHEVIGPAIRQGRAQGLAQGLAEGRAEGEVRLLLRQAEKRFGEVPADVLRRIRAMDTDQLEAAGLRLLDARSFEDLFTR